MSARASAEMITPHTPGPWAVETRADIAWGARLVVFGDRAPGDRGFPVATFGAAGSEENAANAALAAAAPDMLTALRKVILGIGPLPPARPDDCPALRMMREGFDAARAAIAKATQETTP